MANPELGFSRWLFTVMAELKLTQVDVAKGIDESKELIIMFCNNRKLPDARQFLKLCTFISEKMHVPVEYIVERGAAALGVNIYAPLEKRVYMVNRPENDEIKQQLEKELGNAKGKEKDK